ncbi:MAG: YbhN family protein [Anaerolineae bacterium]
MRNEALPEAASAAPSPETSAAPSPASAARGLRRRFMWSLIAALVIYILLIAYADVGTLRPVLRDFPWRWLPLILGLTLVNYAGRLIKWIWYLRLVGSPITAADAARVFGVGMTMVMTPGKAGELLKSYMVKNASGTPIAVTAPIVLAERLTDGLAMLLLAGIGLLSFDDPALRRAAAVALAVLFAVVAVVWIRPLALGLLRIGERVQVVRDYASHARDFYESSYLLLAPRNLLIAVSIGLVSWSFEGLAYYLVLVGVTAGGSAPLAHGVQTALTSIFIFSISTVLGAVMATPGGLGATEAGLVALSQRMLGLDPASATAAALVVRFATLWFGVALGLLSLARWSWLLEGRLERPLREAPD